jgi:hypothetical protein
MATFTEIANYVVASSGTESVIDFNSIPTTYDHIGFWCSFGLNRTVYAEVNGGLQGSMMYTRYNSTSIANSFTASNANIYVTEASANLACPAIVWFDNYKNNNLKKHAGTEGTSNASGDMYTLHTSYSTGSTTAISRVTFKSYGGTFYFTAGTQITLFGVTNT